MFSFIYGVLTGVIVSHLFNCKEMAYNVYKTIYTSSSLEKVSSSIYMLPYKHMGKTYKMFMCIRKGPKQIQRVTDKNETDVTEQVFTYMGPNNTFQHVQVPITPRLMGYDTLHFHTFRGETKTFQAEETIHL